MADSHVPAGGPVLRLRGIGKRFGKLVANDAIDLDLAKGEVVALLGENGAGKTTLMNILFGHYVADAGTIEVAGEKLPPGDPAAALAAGIGMVHQHFTLADNLTVLENVMLGTEKLTAWRSRRAAGAARLVELSRRFGLAADPAARVADLSVGERQRVEILKALYRDVRILILDEPTAVLTPQEAESLFGTLRHLVAAGLSILFISHKMNEVLAISDRVVVLRAGRVAGEVATKSTTRHALAELMVGREVPPPQVDPLPAGAAVIRLDNVSIDAPSAAARLENVSLELRATEIVGIAGVSGNGQSALFDLLAGLARPDRGDFMLAGEDAGALGPRALVRRGVGRIPEDRHSTGGIGDMSIPESLIVEDYREPAFARFGVVRRAAVRDFAARIVRDFDVRLDRLAQRTRLLSGGNMQKLILGRVLTRNPRVILANQPTRGLDVGAVAYVHGRLLEARAKGAAVLLISEDLDELLALSDRIAVMHRGHLSAPLPREAVDIGRLGLMMAGEGMAHAS